mmetsp:Transcript_72304/g.172673  ORF Transcript_72304/g.172673 Transcript_72304/m.172673 type:complete len:277 (+) Transcript_72304:446-1276(+)
MPHQQDSQPPLHRGRVGLVVIGDASRASQLRKLGAAWAWPIRGRLPSFGCPCSHTAGLLQHAQILFCDFVPDVVLQHCGKEHGVGLAVGRVEDSAQLVRDGVDVAHTHTREGCARLEGAALHLHPRGRDIGVVPRRLTGQLDVREDPLRGHQRLLRSVLGGPDAHKALDRMSKCIHASRCHDSTGAVLENLRVQNGHLWNQAWICQHDLLLRFRQANDRRHRGLGASSGRGGDRNHGRQLAAGDAVPSHLEHAVHVKQVLVRVSDECPDRLGTVHG